MSDQNSSHWIQNSSHWMRVMGSPLTKLRVSGLLINTGRVRLPLEDDPGGDYLLLEGSAPR